MSCSKAMSAYEPKGPSGRSLSWFLQSEVTSMKQLGVFIFLGKEANPFAGLPLNSMVRGTVWVKHLPQEHTTKYQAITLTYCSTSVIRISSKYFPRRFTCLSGKWRNLLVLGYLVLTFFACCKLTCACIAITVHTLACVYAFQFHLKKLLQSVPNPDYHNYSEKGYLKQQAAKGGESHKLRKCDWLPSGINVEH